jgi:hypothetical protein
VAGGGDVRAGWIIGKLAAARALPALPTAFGVQQHRFELGAPLPEAAVADFEARHGVLLPEAYRLFVTEVGDGGAGPGYRLDRLGELCDRVCRPGHLAQASPYLPGPRYLGDWAERYEDPPGPDQNFLRGTLAIANHGCSLSTCLIVTGPARGRLFNLDVEGHVGPYVVEDVDFLAWYERWLDEAVAGYDVGWFGERLPLDESALIAALAEDPSPARRVRAGESLLSLPTVSDNAWIALTDAVYTDPDPIVRAELLHVLTRQRRDRQRRPDPDASLADEIAQLARSGPRPAFKALALVQKLTLDDLLPELAGPDLERRRAAAYHLAWNFPGPARSTVPHDVLDGVAQRLLTDPDPLLRCHGIAVVRWCDLTSLFPALDDLQDAETDPWVREHLNWWIFRHAFGDPGR